MEAKSGVTFEEAQVALARQWIGNQAHAKGKDAIKEVYVQVLTHIRRDYTDSNGNTKTKKFRLPSSEEKASG